jgi:hypothetical protein
MRTLVAAILAEMSIGCGAPRLPFTCAQKRALMRSSSWLSFYCDRGSKEQDRQGDRSVQAGAPSQVELTRSKARRKSHYYQHYQQSRYARGECGIGSPGSPLELAPCHNEAETQKAAVKEGLLALLVGIVTDGKSNDVNTRVAALVLRWTTVLLSLSDFSLLRFLANSLPCRVRWPT